MCDVLEGYPLPILLPPGKRVWYSIWRIRKRSACWSRVWHCATTPYVRKSASGMTFRSPNSRTEQGYALVKISNPLSTSDWEQLF